jgi:hypothetical protein
VSNHDNYDKDRRVSGEHLQVQVQLGQKLVFRVIFSITLAWNASSGASASVRFSLEPWRWYPERPHSAPVNEHDALPNSNHRR